MFYVVNDHLMAKLKKLLTNETQENIDERVLLLQELVQMETNPILSCLLWTKMDLIAECRGLIQGKNPQNSDGTLFDKTVVFTDPFRERLANEMAGNVDELCLGNRNDVASDIALAAEETIIYAVSQELESMEIDQDTSQDLSGLLILDYFSQLAPAFIAQGFQSCVHHVANAIRLELLEHPSNKTGEAR